MEYQAGNEPLPESKLAQPQKPERKTMGFYIGPDCVVHPYTGRKDMIKLEQDFTREAQKILGP